MNFNFDNMNNPSEQPKQDDLNPKEIMADEELETEENSAENKETEVNKLNLSNDDLEFFINELKKKGMENSIIFSFTIKELKKRKENNIDSESIKLSENQNKDNGTSEEYLKELKEYNNEKLVNNIKQSLEMWEESIKKESIRATSGLKTIEEKIEEAKTKQRNIDPSLVEKFEKDLKDSREKAYFAEVMGFLNKADEFAEEFINNGDVKYKEAVENWIFHARDRENKHKENINKFDLDKIDERIKKICAVVDFDENDISREEFQKGEEDHKRLLAIHQEISEKIDITNLSSKEGEVESGSSIEQEKLDSNEITGEELIKIEKINTEEEEKSNSEKNARLEKWDKEENKEQIIGEEKDNIERELGNRITVENPKFIEQKNIREILKSHDELRNLRNELIKEVEQNIENRKIASDGIRNQIDLNVDMSQLSIGDQMEAEATQSKYLKTAKNVLSVKEIDYLLQIGNEVGDLGDLSGTHEERKIEMEKLQEIIEAIEEYRKFMEEFEKLTEEEQEEAREEIGKFVEWLEQIKEHKKEFFWALVAMGVVAGVAALVMSVGLPAGMSAPAFLTAKNLVVVGGALAAGGAGYYLYKKEKIQATLKTAAMAIGLPIIGGAMVLDSILNSEKIDGWMKSLCGVDLPSWAKDSKKKS